RASEDSASPPQTPERRLHGVELELQRLAHRPASADDGGDGVQRELERSKQSNGLQIREGDRIVETVARRGDASGRQQAEVGRMTNRLDRHAARSRELADRQQVAG